MCKTGAAIEPSAAIDAMTTAFDPAAGDAGGRFQAEATFWNAFCW
jgi:hypothetical protein